MKNILKLVALLIVAFMIVGAFAACNGDSDTGNTTDNGNTNTNNNTNNNTNTDPGNTDDGGNTPAPTPTPDGDVVDDYDQNKTYSVVFKFVDPNGNALVNTSGEKPETEADIVRSVKGGKAALAPRGVIDDLQRYDDWVIVGWDSNGDGKADDIYSKVGRSLEVKTICRPKVDCTVTFVNEREEPIENGVLTLKEGAEITNELCEANFVIPVEVGKYFKGWTLASNSAESNSSVTCIADNCTFMPTYGATQGTIPLVTDTISIDGKKDSVYNNAAYLPLNNQRQAEGGAAAEDDPSVVGNLTSQRYKTKTTAGAYMVWDGEFLYILVEVSDKTLCGRNTFYINAVPNSFFNDTVELFYTFEQDTASNNKTKVGLDAQGVKLYSITRSQGLRSGKSTHFEEIEYAALNALTSEGVASGLSVTGYAADGTTDVPSYRVEFKIPAKTEGVPDEDAGADPTYGFLGSADDYESEEAFKNAITEADKDKTGSRFAFTDGKALKAGDFFRVALQVCDLMVPQDVLANPESGCHEDPSKTGKSAWLYNAEGTEVYPKFSAVAQTQYATKYYVMFSLGATDEALTTVYSFSADQKFLDANGKDITPRDE